MLHHINYVKTLIRGVTGRSEVSVVETNFGYVIRSEKPKDEITLRERAGKFLVTALGVSALGVWLVPMSGLPLVGKLGLSLAMILAGFGGLWLMRSTGNGVELHVDMTRREVRAAQMTPSGQSWIKANARFAEIADVFIQHPKPQKSLFSLHMRVIGEDQLMPAAIGDETTLLAIYKRLKGDLKPVEEKLVGFRLNSGPERVSKRAVFPELGPEEVRG